MVDRETVRALAAALPGVVDDSTADGIALAAGGRGIAWTFMERVHPKKPRVPRLPILAVRCPIERKDLLLEVAPDIYFDDPHYLGYPAVLVRLEAIDAEDLRALLADAAGWAVAAPPKRPRKV